MNVLVCVSRVPDTAARVKVGEDGKNIDENGVKFIVNPYDEFALETGIRLKESAGANVTALVVGPDTAQDVLRTAYAMGVDKAILVKNDNGNSDSYSVAEDIAAVAKELNSDLVIMGRQSIDYDSFSKSSMVGAMLDKPSISVVSKLEINDGKVLAERDIEGGKETIESSLPCVISVQKGIYDPRYPKLPDIMKAKKKPIDIKESVNSGVKTEVLSMGIPQTSRVGKIVGDSESEINEIIDALHKDAKVI
ncbi:electron transfer flavoprotein subunit beta/FixA family protein [Candidatus Kapabacteria bacterium]|nr:electron transfer flavoprotein subunit beta/FixA family protein [Candidatus Kapabacteria bacterium]